MKIQNSLLRGMILASMLLVVSAGSASAATEVGSRCAVSNSGNPVMIQASASAGASYQVPASGILTKWGVNASSWGSSSMLSAIFGRLDGGNWTITRSTPYQRTSANTANEYEARMSVVAGESLGVIAYNSSALMCSGFSPTDDVIASSASTLSPGDSFAPSPIPTFRVAIWAIVEPDVDGDGFGDDTQDKCPQSAEFQDACPVLAISQQLSANSKQISILATASEDASLTATAKVKVGRKTVTIKGKATTFTAGKLKSIKLKLPSSVKNALKSGKKLTASVTLTGNGIANTATVTGKLKLRK